MKSLPSIKLIAQQVAPFPHTVPDELPTRIPNNMYPETTFHVDGLNSSQPSCVWLDKNKIVLGYDVARPLCHIMAHVNYSQHGNVKSSHVF